MKLSEWAKINGIKYKTAWQWVKNNTMPCDFYQTKTGTIIVLNNINREQKDENFYKNKLLKIKEIVNEN